MDRFWVPRASSRLLLTSILLTFILNSLEFCSSLNDEGKVLLKFKAMVETDPYDFLSDWVVGGGDGNGGPCLWSGVRCEDSRVVSLNLGNLGLKGKLIPELGKLNHLRYLILNNNSFSGIIPRELLEMQKIELLDLRCNNLMEPLGPNTDIFYLENLALKCDQFPPIGLHEMKIVAKVHRKPVLWAARKLMMRKLLNASVGNVKMINYTQGVKPRLSNHTLVRPNPRNDSVSENLPVEPSTSSPSPPNVKQPVDFDPHLGPALTSTKSQSQHSKHLVFYIPVAIGACVVLIVITFILYHRFSKVVAVKPWATGLSGQLQRAFVTGVPVLRRVELETACEDFSNIIGSFKDCTLYKGTLSSGVEIAVTSAVVKSANEWTKQAQAQFRKKIAILSRVNHKNFVNLLGYCEEAEPFTRMMVFEYAPNGTLFDHLHIKEVADLNWAARIRVAMGIAYCLEHMHHLNPPVIIGNLESSSIYLTDDYAAKIWDLELWSETTSSEADSVTSSPLPDQMPNQESVVYKYGLILLEIISGRLPYSEEHGELRNWASDYLSGSKSLKELIDPELVSFGEDDARKICEVIKSCLNPDLNERPSIKEIAEQLREITSVLPEGATPKLSPLWWAELEIITNEVN